jgi:hypothetical protein
MTPGLQEFAAYYSNRMSYEDVEGIVGRISGERFLSDQHIEQLVIDKAVEVSQGWAQAAQALLEVAARVVVNTAAALYAVEAAEIQLFEDGIGVKG